MLPYDRLSWREFDDGSIQVTLDHDLSVTAWLRGVRIGATLLTNGNGFRVRASNDDCLSFEVNAGTLAINGAFLVGCDGSELEILASVAPNSSEGGISTRRVTPRVHIEEALVVPRSRTESSAPSNDDRSYISRS